jgi:hypothetical protein
MMRLAGVAENDILFHRPKPDKSLFHHHNSRAISPNAQRLCQDIEHRANAMERYLYHFLLKKKPYNRTGWGTQKRTFATLLCWMKSERRAKSEYRMSIG